jgi:hypothetical protein
MKREDVPPPLPWLLAEFGVTAAGCCAAEGVSEVVDLSNPALDARGVIAINQRGNLGELVDRGRET